MAKNQFLDWDTSASGNTDVGGIGILGTNAVSNFDDALRTIMAQLKAGVDGKQTFSNKSAGYTAVAADNNTVLRFTSSQTLALTAAATLGANWKVTVIGDGGDVTIDPNGAETIDGLATLVVHNGQRVLVYCDGSNFRTVRSPSLFYVNQAVGLTAIGSDSGGLWRFSTSVTLALTAAATLGVNWNLTVFCDAGGLIIDPNSAETINGLSTLILYPGQWARIVCDGANFFANIGGSTFSTIANRTHISGLQLANSAGDPTNDIDIGPGEAVSSDSSYYLMQLAGGITKRLDAAWAVGTGNGGLDTGSIANTDYHVYLIRRPDTGVVDGIFSASASLPALPSGYTQYRRVGTIKRQSNAIVLFAQFLDTFYLQVPRQDLNQGNPGTSGVARTLTVPSGIVVEAIYTVDISSQTTTALYACLMTATTQADSAAAYGSVMTLGLQTGSAAGFYRASVVNRTWTNTSGQVRQRFSASDANMATTIVTHGWVDLRGKE